MAEPASVRPNGVSAPPSYNPPQPPREGQGPLHGTRTGIGTALKTARESRGISLDKASRDTRIHSEYLKALERESFAALRADVYVRGFLRSYSSYLGLDADKVIRVYDRRAPSKPVTAPQPPPQDEERDLGAPRRGVRWQLVAAMAVVLLAVFGAVGLLTRTGSAPAASQLPIAGPAPATPSSVVTLHVTTPDRAAKAVVVADGVLRFKGTLWMGSSRTYRAHSVLRVSFSPGGAVGLTVNGHELGKPGDPGARYQASFTPADFRSQEATPSASA